MVVDNGSMAVNDKNWHFFDKKLGIFLDFCYLFCIFVCRKATFSGGKNYVFTQSKLRFQSLKTMFSRRRNGTL